MSDHTSKQGLDEVEIRAAIADPGSVLPRRNGSETIPSWCARAVVAVLGGARGQADEPDPDLDDDPTLTNAW